MSGYKTSEKYAAELKRNLVDAMAETVLATAQIVEVMSAEIDAGMPAAYAYQKACLQLAISYRVAAATLDRTPPTPPPAVTFFTRPVARF